ncbi:beta-lactamase-like protein [Zopfochytrium polystomum]|nr:beta-lactamase-like protein [Zopfochytrium polystomum]
MDAPSASTAGAASTTAAAATTTTTDFDLTFLGTASAIPSLTRNVTSVAVRCGGEGELWLVDCGEATQHQFLKLPAAFPSFTAHTSSLSPSDGDGDGGDRDQPPQPSPPRLSKLTKVFITHLHGDHCFGLPGLLCTVNALRNAGARKGDDSLRVVDVYGPKGLRAFLQTAVRAGDYHTRYGFRVHELLHPGETTVPPPTPDHGSVIYSESIDDHASAFPPMPDAPPAFVPREMDPPPSPPPSVDPATRVWRLFETPTVSAYAAFLHHDPYAPCVGFVFQEAAKPGRLDAARASALLAPHREALAAAAAAAAAAASGKSGKKAGGAGAGFNPNVLLGRLKRGEAVALPDGTSIRPEDVVGPAQRGRRVAVLGDTAQPSEAAARLCWGGGVGCDVLVHEATNAALEQDLDDDDNGNGGGNGNDGGERVVVGGGGTREERMQALRAAVRAQTIAHGHSTPEMAGAFARRVGARALVLSHFSNRYKDDGDDGGGSGGGGGGGRPEGDARDCGDGLRGVRVGAGGGGAGFWARRGGSGAVAILCSLLPLIL